MEPSWDLIEEGFELGAELGFDESPDAAGIFESGRARRGSLATAGWEQASDVAAWVARRVSRSWGDGCADADADASRNDRRSQNWVCSSDVDSGDGYI